MLLYRYCLVRTARDEEDLEEVLIVVYFLRGVVLPVVEVMMWMRDKAEIYELSSSCDMCVEDVSTCVLRESVVDI